MTMAMLGALVTLAAAFALYLASPNQRMILTAVPRRALRWGGWAGLLLGLVLLLGWAGPATAVFIGLTLAMLVWTLVPLAVAWWRRPRGNAE